MTNGNTHIVCHCDADGLCSAAIVKQYYRDASVIVTNYKKPLHLNKFKPGDTIFVVDFSLEKDIFEMLAGRNIRIIWIDHHKQTYEKIQSQGFNCEGIRRDDFAGAALTWMYFNPDKQFDQAPDFVKLTNWYDLWQHDKDPRIRAFAYGLGLWDTRPGYVAGDRFWSSMFSNELGDKLMQNIIKYGSDIQKYVEKYQDTICKDLAYKVMLETPQGPKRLLAMAIRPGNSSTFERQDVSDVDALFTGQYMAGNTQQYRCGMYSPDGQKEILYIANMFGGGGHPTAAGFTLPRYPINTPTPTKPRPLEEVVKEFDELYKMREASPILLKYAHRSNAITAKVSGWHTKLAGINVMAFNHQYIPEMLAVLPTSVECFDTDTGDVAEAYVGFVMTNSGYFRCCAYPSSTSTKAEDLLIRLQNRYMKQVTEDCFNFKLINGGVWWYQPDEPVSVPINFNLQSVSAN